MLSVLHDERADIRRRVRNVGESRYGFSIRRVRDLLLI